MIDVEIQTYEFVERIKSDVIISPHEVSAPRGIRTQKALNGDSFGEWERDVFVGGVKAGVLRSEDNQYRTIWSRFIPDAEIARVTYI